MSGILTQISPTDGCRTAIAYASRTLTDAETRYGQIEREALAIHFARLKFQLYLLGKQFIVITCRKPLVHIFNRPKTQMPYRVERIGMKLQGFDFYVKYVQGSRNPSDYMTRNPIPITNTYKRASRELEKHVNFVVEEGLSKAVTIDEIKTRTINDEVVKLLCESIKLVRLMMKL